MTKKREYRTNGAIGALLDEYENALNALYSTIDGLSEQQLTAVVDSETEDEDCRSIQSVLTHVVQSGFTYGIEIRKWLGEDIEYRDKVILNSVEKYQSALAEMFTFMETLFKEHPDIKLNEFAAERRIKVRWGQSFDVEQILQHAIVHVLRHRRQIEIFKRENNPQIA